MIDIQIEVDQARDLTIVNIKGLPNAQALIDLHFRPEYGTTRRVIWDYRHASLSGLTPDSLVNVVQSTRHTDHQRKTQALALVVRDEDELMLVKLYTEICLRMFDRAVHYLVTRSMDEAEAWITDLALPPVAGMVTASSDPDDGHQGETISPAG